MKGIVTCEFAVWCGVCCDWDQLSGPIGQAIDVWRSSGWELTDDVGWVCPRCAARRKRETSERDQSCETAQKTTTSV